jgi:hypothetical protein
MDREQLALLIESKTIAADRSLLDYKEMGRVAIIPEGMSVLRTLTNEEFKRRFRETKSLTVRMAEKFEREEGYPPPYWELVEMAKRP